MKKILHKQPKEIIAVRIPPELHGKIKAICKKQKVSKTDVVMAALEQFLGTEK